MKNCHQCKANFEVSETDRKFLHNLSPSFGGKTFELPEPKLCPDCRAQRRMSFGNQRHLYHRTCAGTGKKIISNYSPDKQVPVFDIEYWWSDAWPSALRNEDGSYTYQKKSTDGSGPNGDQFATGRDYDFSRPFFEQFAELMQVAPRPALQRAPQFDENSDYTNYAGKNRNCYLIFDSDKNEDCCYSYSINSSRDVIDCLRVGECELCYECLDCTRCYQSIYLQNCDNCSTSAFLKNCIGCKNCFGCVNLSNKEYHFFNEPCTKEQYVKKVKALELHTHSGLERFKRQFWEFCLQQPHKASEGVQNEDCHGNYITQCKNAYQCFDSRKLWDCRYVQQSFDDAKNSMDCTEIGDGVELLYECCYVGYTSYHDLFVSHALGQTSELMYCFSTPNCKNLFGCIGLRNAQYCILNKQYSKEEYEKLVPKIIEHMSQTGEFGEFFPTSLSPFAYNESHASEYFPLSQNEVKTRGWKWYEDSEGAGYQGPKVELAESIYEVSDDIGQQILACEQTGKPYKIIRQELELYRKMGVPIPRLCPDQRFEARLARRNPRKLWQRSCGSCSKKIETSFSPDRPAIGSEAHKKLNYLQQDQMAQARREKVLCEECYLQVIY